jgi:hypothetical protein
MSYDCSDKEKSAMNRTMRSAFVLLAIVALAALAQAVYPPSPASGSPYLSALSSAFVPAAFATPNCFRGCSGGSRHNLRCGDVTTATSCKIFNGSCITGAC